jgi:hypothetical protein
MRAELSNTRRLLASSARLIVQSHAPLSSRRCTIRVKDFLYVQLSGLTNGDT